MSVPTADDEEAAIAADVAAAKRGDAAAFERLVRRYQRRLFAVLVRRLGRRSDAEDVLQNTFLLAWRKLDQFRGEARFSTWLTRIAMTQATSFGRRLDARSPPQSLDQRESKGATVTAPTPDPSEAAAARDESARREGLVRDAIGQLPPDQRDVVVLKEFDNRSYEEIASIIDCPVGTVRSRLHRARQELARRLAPLLAVDESGAAQGPRVVQPASADGAIIA